MAKRDWMVFAMIAGASFLATALVASSLFGGSGCAKRSFAESAWSFSWPFFPGFAVTATALFAVLRKGITEGRSFVGSILRCWGIAAVTATLTPVYPFLFYAYQRGDSPAKDLAFFEVVAAMGFVIGLPGSLLAGIILAFALHRRRNLDSSPLLGAKLPTSVFFP